MGSPIKFEITSLYLSEEVPVAEESREERRPDFRVARVEEEGNGHLNDSTSDININKVFRESRRDFINISRTKLTSAVTVVEPCSRPHSSFTSLWQDLIFNNSGAPGARTYFLIAFSSSNGVSSQWPWCPRVKQQFPSPKVSSQAYSSRESQICIQDSAVDSSPSHWPRGYTDYQYSANR
jgi:hypothetical protein